MVALWADGFNYTPALFFTHNPTFDPKGKRWAQVKEWCRVLKIDTERIVYVKGDKKYNYEK